RRPHSVGAPPPGPSARSVRRDGTRAPLRTRAPVKVALLSDWYLPRLGGLELHIRDLAEGLAARGCEVHVLTPNPAEPARQAKGLPAVAVPPPAGVLVHRLDVPLHPTHGFVYTRGAFRTLDRHLREGHYDVVQAMVG